MKHTHFNEWGKPCKCTAGRNPGEKPENPHWEEHLGWTIEAAKLDWLHGREDMQDTEAKEFLHHLATRFPDHDALYPWLTREWKRKRLDMPSNGIGDRYAPFYYLNHDGSGKTPMTGEDVERLQDYVDYQKAASRQNKNIKGVDLDKHEIGHLMHAAKEWDQGGETVHAFGPDDDTGKYYQGWTIKRLRNKRDMVREGRLMSHCIGSNGMPYIDKNNAGTGLYYSLRDPQNNPKGTLEMGRRHQEGTPVWVDEHGNVQSYVPEAWHNPETNRYEPVHVEEDEKGIPTIPDHPSYTSESGSKFFKKFPYKFRGKVDPHNPSSDHWAAQQLFGYDDKRLDHDHEQLFNDWLSKHGHGYVESDGDDPYDEEEEEFEPWWDDYYTLEGPQDADDYLNDVNYGPTERLSDDHDYWRAHADANEHEMEGPDLDVESPYWPGIVEDMANYPQPEQIAKVVKAARDNDDWGELSRHMQDWLDDEYTPYLDPYGTNMESYPDDPQGHHDNEKYAALNFQYHLDRMRDPQTGHPMDSQWEWRNRQNVPMGTNELQGPGDNPAAWQQPNLFQDTDLQQERHWNEKIRNQKVVGDQLEQEQTDLWRRQMQLEELIQNTPSGPEQGEYLHELDDIKSKLHLNGLKLQDARQFEEMHRNQQREAPQAPRVEDFNIPQIGRYYDKMRHSLVEAPGLPPHLFPPERYEPVGHPGALPLWGYGTPPMRASEPQRNLTMEPYHPAWEPGQTGDFDPRLAPQVPWTAKTAQILHTDAKDYPQMPRHEWRVPVLHDFDNGTTVFGQPSMEHKTMLQNFPEYSHIQNPWDHDNFLPGYVDLDGTLGDAGLHWFNPDKGKSVDPSLHDYVEDKYGVRATGDIPSWMKWHEDE